MALSVLLPWFPRSQDRLLGCGLLLEPAMKVISEDKGCLGKH